MLNLGLGCALLRSGIRSLELRFETLPSVFRVRPSARCARVRVFECLVARCAYASASASVLGLLSFLRSRGSGFHLRRQVCRLARADARQRAEHGAGDLQEVTTEA